jgi:imidazolonepropionase-like amidohydrolase
MAYTSARPSRAPFVAVAAVLGAVLALGGCATTAKAPPKGAAIAPAPAHPPRAGLDPALRPDPFPSTYHPAVAPPVAFVNATILTAIGPRIDGGTLVIADGKIAAVGRDVAVPAGVRVIDAHGRWLTPGIVDPHSHIGSGASPGAASGDGSNESGPNPGAVWIEHSTWTQDPMFDRALAAGVTTIQLLPGSSNLFNGRTVIVKNVPAVTPQEMKFPGAPYGLKLACGENPTSGGPGKASTRAGAMAGFRATFIAGAEYAQRWQDYRRKAAAGQGGEPPHRDLALETVAGALNGDIKVHIHCYRSDDMLQMIDLSHEFGFKIAAFHHALEAFKIAPILAREKIAVVTWAGDWSGYKMEAYDSIMENAAFVQKAGGVVTMHSDNVMLMQHLNQEAARAMTAGREAGLGTTPEDAIRWVTLNPANVIGVGDRTGSLEVGKMADVVLWDTDPFSVYALPDLVLIDGVTRHDRLNPAAAPQSDFELGNVRRREPAASPVPTW